MAELKWGDYIGYGSTASNIEANHICISYDISDLVQESVDKKFEIAWKAIRKFKWTKGFNCRRRSRTFGSWR